MATTVVGKKVGPIGFGLMSLTNPANGLSDDQACAAIKTALDAGCTFMDGGQFYGPPEKNSLTLLNKYFAKYPEDADKIVLNIKGAYGPFTGPTGSKEDTAKSIDTCLSMLGPVGRITQFEPARKDLAVDYEDDTLATIDSYVKAGKIGGIACSEVNADTLRSAAKKFKITGLEIEFSFFNRDSLTNGLFETCGELDIPVFAYSPLGNGFLGGKIKSMDDVAADDYRRHSPRFDPENFALNVKLAAKVEALATKKGCTPGQIAINWIIAVSKRPGMPLIIPIPGSSKPDRIAENAKVVELTKEDLAEIENILADFKPAGSRYPARFQGELGR